MDFSCPPRQQHHLIGHTKALEHMVAQRQQGRLHPAWILSGPRGIGKATLAYHVARQLLTEGTGNEAFLSGLIDQNAHPNLLCIERQVDEDGALQNEIRVDDVRRVLDFAHQSAAFPGWRVVVIDAIDEMNRNAANALLKILEEPPQETIFLLVCHALGRILPTIRSRCCLLPLQSLSPEEMSSAGITSTTDLQIMLAEGSVGRLMESQAQNVEGLLNNLLQSINDALAGQITRATGLADTFEKGDPAVPLLHRLFNWVAYRLVGLAHGEAKTMDADEKIMKLVQQRPPQHWLAVQQGISSITHLGQGAHLDQGHFIRSMILIYQSPSLARDLVLS